MNYKGTVFFVCLSCLVFVFSQRVNAQSELQTVVPLKELCVNQELELELDQNEQEQISNEWIVIRKQDIYGTPEKLLRKTHSKNFKSPLLWGDYIIQHFSTDLTGFKHSKVYHVNVYHEPTPKFYISTTEHYQHEALHFVNNSENTTQYAKYIWDFGDGSVSSEKNPTHIFATPGIYIVSLEATNATCSNAIQKSISILPKKELKSSSVTWEGESSNVHEDVNNNHELDNTNLSSDTNIGVINNNSSPKPNIQMDENTAINSQLDYEIFPNPAGDELTLRPLKAPVPGTEIMIFNAQGKVYIGAQLKTSFSESKLDVSALKEGIYFISIYKNGKQVQSTRLVKQ